MDSLTWPDGLEAFTTPATRELVRVYDDNAARHDPLIGDDAITFGINIYRNSWHSMERVVEELDGWTSSRPDGSLVISGADVRIHVYRHGQNERVDLYAFRLDENASETKRLIAATNHSQQLALDLGPAGAPAVRKAKSGLRELVIVHAGNPEDGCCGVWIGAPLPIDEIRVSPWDWIECLWLIERTATAPPVAGDAQRTRHDQLPEPDVDVEPIERPGAQEQSE